MQANGEILLEQIQGNHVPREIKRGSVETIEFIGEGAFGKVCKAMLDESSNFSNFYSGSIPAYAS